MSLPSGGAGPSVFTRPRETPTVPADHLAWLTRQLVPRRRRTLVQLFYTDTLSFCAVSAPLALADMQYGDMFMRAIALLFNHAANYLGVNREARLACILCLVRARDRDR